MPPRRRNPEDRVLVRELSEKLEDFKRAVMEAGGDDPDDTNFDPMEYPIFSDTIESYLDTKVLGWGASRVVVLLPTGNVAKLPWNEAGQQANDAEWDTWNEASEEVQELLLPPLENVRGVVVYPRVKTVTDRDYDDPELAAARERWRRLVKEEAPGAVAWDYQNTNNWGIYGGNVVLIDYAE
jgi:hypothetical protein